MRGWHLAAVTCGFVSLLLLLIALGSDHWLDIGNANIGLWKGCVESPLVGTICDDLGMNVEGYLHATRAFMILGMCAGLISCTLLSVLLFRAEIGSYPIVKMVVISSHVAGLLALIAMATYTGYWGKNDSYRWSFILGWVCIPLFHITGGLAPKAIAYTQF